jgi:hypothetical protein
VRAAASDGGAIASYKNHTRNAVRIAELYIFTPREGSASLIRNRSKQTLDQGTSTSSCFVRVWYQSWTLPPELIELINVGDLNRALHARVARLPAEETLLSHDARYMHIIATQSS